MHWRKAKLPKRARLFAAAVALLAGTIPASAAGPFAATQAATSITASNATLTGMALPNGQVTTVWFEWGNRVSLTHTTTPVNIGAGAAVMRVTSVISNLTAHGSYQCRLVASNAVGLKYGAAQFFTTGNRVGAWGNYPPVFEGFPAGLTSIVAVACGSRHTFALGTDGKVIAWGADNNYGQTSVPADLSNVVAVAAGEEDGLALRADGSVTAWGQYYDGSNLQPMYVPAGLSNVVALAGGANHAFALRADGTIAAWGNNSDGQCNVPPGLSNVVAVAAGDFHSLALRADGHVVAWGGDSSGQTEVPPALVNVVGVTAGSAHSLVLRADGTLKAWGNYNGWISGIPAGLSNIIIAVSAFDESLVVLGSGAVSAWGRDDYGQADVPLGLTNVTGLAAGYLHSVVLGDNTPPQALASAFSGPANQDLVLGLSAADINFDPYTLRISSLPATGALYQYNSGVRGAAITASGTPVSDAGGRVIFVPVTNTFGSPYATFNFIANDGFSDSSPAAITINISGSLAFTQPATDLRPSSANLNGMVTPNHLVSAAWFEWGPRGGYGQTTAPVAVGIGAGVVRVSSGISNLTAHGTYQCRLVVSNASAVTYGAAELFTTGERVAEWAADDQSLMPSAVSNAVAVAAGYLYSLVLHSDGMVRAWGLNDSGQATVPPALSNVVAIAAGARHSLALRSGGTVAAWGDNGVGQTSVPPGLSNVVSISAGGNHCLALGADGTVAAWGYNNAGQASAPVGLSNVVAVAAGGYHSLALRADGTVVAWGANDDGQATIPPNLEHVVRIAAGWSHSAALRADGTMVAWGQGYFGQADVVAGSSNFVAVAAGENYTLGLRADGTLAGSGHYSSGGLIYLPAVLSNLVAVSAGAEYVLALGNIRPQARAQTVYGTANQDLVITLGAADLNADGLSFKVSALHALGTLYQYNAGGRGPALASPGTIVSDAAGRLIFAPLPDGFGRPYTTFNFVANDGVADSSAATITVNISTSTAFTQPATAIHSTDATVNGMAIPNGFVAAAWFEWGPRGTYNQSTAPIPVGGGNGVVHVSAAISNLLAGAVYQFRLVISNAVVVNHGVAHLFSTGERVSAWGYNDAGRARPPAGLTNAVAIAAGASHSLALRSDGTVVAWGDNSHQQTNVPPDLTNATAAATFWWHTLALRPDGTVAVWGDNGSGQTNLPAGLSNVVALAAGGYHSLALRGDGTVVAFGWNAYNQTNVPPEASNIVAVAAGYYHSAALRADGRVLVWGVPGFADYGITKVPGMDEAIGIFSGQNFLLAPQANGTLVAWGDSQVAVPPGLSNVVTAAAGLNHALALRANGTILGWGYNSYGQATIPSGLSNIVAVAGGGYHSLALGNAQPVAQSQSVHGAANEDLVIQLLASDINNDLLSFRITSLPGAGTLYQYSGGGRGALITVPNTLVSDPLGRVIFVPLANAYSSPYASFNFVANDGLVDSVPALVMITIQQSRAATQFATRIHPTGATLNGMALPNSFASTAWFQWGPRGSYNQATAPVSVGNGFGVVRVSAPVSNLLAGAAYQFRLTVSNANGIIHGGLQLFTTGDRILGWANSYDGETNVPPGLTNAVAVAGGGTHSLALRSDGTVVGWGLSSYNSYGQANPPAGLTNAVAISAGNSHSLALRDDGSVLAWGAGGPGPDGYPHYGQSAVPPGLVNVISVAAGYFFSLALRADGTVAAWGENYYGETNVPSGLSNVVAIAAGSSHALALKADGTVTVWGDNGWGQATVPLGLENVRAIGAGAYHSLAVDASGGVFIWGVHYVPEGPSPILVPPPAGFTNGLAVAGGARHSLGLDADGNVFAWGYDDGGTTIVPAGLARVVALAAGQYHNLALGGQFLPLANAATVTGPANHDFIIALDGSSANGPLSFRVAALPAAGKLYQYAAGQRGPAISVPGTGVADGDGQVIFAPFANGFGNPYSAFSFLANDGEADSLPALVTINILPPVSPVISSFLQNSNGVFQLAFAGDSNTTYCVWASTNLANWEYLGLAAQATPGTFQFQDLSVGTSPQRFYRISTGCGTPVPRLSGNSAKIPGGAFALSFTGGPYWSYRVWASTNLVNWELLGPATETAPGVFRFSDSSATNWPLRFYKAGAP